MLRQLSFRNVKRQMGEYLLYMVTLICAVAFMFAFHALIFSDKVKALKGMDVLPLFIAATSALIIFILGWLVNYMTNYMLRKRSRELGTYMVLGISGREIRRLLLRENLLMGGFAFLAGLAPGILLSQLLEAALCHAFGLLYVPSFRFLIPAAGLTLLYFGAIFWAALFLNKRWMRKLKLTELLSYDRMNESGYLEGTGKTLPVFLTAVLSGIAGGTVLLKAPFGSGYSVLVGLVLIVLGVFGFFISVPPFLAMCFERDRNWKFQKDRMLTLRLFASRLGEMSVMMAVLCILFTLAAAAWGVGIAGDRIAAKSIADNPFDLMILHPGERKDFSKYEEEISGISPVADSYAYPIFTGGGTAFSAIHKDAVEQFGKPMKVSFLEFSRDPYLRQSDYRRLRQMLGYPVPEMEEGSCYIHCSPLLSKTFERCLGEKQGNLINGKTYTVGGIYTEPFCQMNTYGNGLDYIVIVPDETAAGLEILYSLYVAVTKEPLSNERLEELVLQDADLVWLNRTMGKSVPGTDLCTSLVQENVDFVSGKWVQKETLTGIYALLVSLFYLAFILEITGSAILGTQVLSNREKKRRNDQILSNLGMSLQQIRRLEHRQHLLLFLIPALPALAISGCLIYVGASGMQFMAYELPVFTAKGWIFGIIGAAALLFTALYMVYYAVVCISSRG